MVQTRVWILGKPVGGPDLSAGVRYSWFVSAGELTASKTRGPRWCLWPPRSRVMGLTLFMVSLGISPSSRDAGKMDPKITLKHID